MRVTAAMLLSVMWLAAASASTITVNTTDDESNTDGDCSLREAVRTVNTGVAKDACAPADADTIHVPAGTYLLDLTGADSFAATGDLDIKNGMTIEGDGAGLTIIDGNATDRIFEVATTEPVTIRDLTMTHGSAPGDLGGAITTEFNAVLTLTDCAVEDSTASNGAGVHQFGGMLTMQRCTVTGNVSTGDGGGVYFREGDGLIEDCTIDDNDSAAMGGGILAAGSSDPFTVDVVRTTVSNNHATNAGGAVVASNGSTVNLENSTLSGNSAGTNGGAVMYTFANAITLNNVTVTNNTATGGDVGGILRGSGSGGITIRNSIVAGNFAPMGSSPDCYGSIASGGHNLIGSLGSGCTLTGTTTGNVIGATTLGPLANNGGYTMTHLPAAMSAAIDGGDPSMPGSGGTSCEATDQRTAARPGGSACDIGAVESDATPPTTTTTSSSTSSTSTSIVTTSTTSTSSTSSTSSSVTTTTTTTTSTAPPVSTTTTIVTTTTGPPPPTSTTTTTPPSPPPPLCVHPAGISGGVITIAKLGTKLTFTGTVDLPAGTPPVLDPAAQGMQLVVDRMGTPPVVILPFNAALPIPPGARGTGCGAKDGWKKTSYTNGSGAMPPDCIGHSAYGLRSVKLKDRRAKGGGIAVTVKVAGVTLPSSSGTMRATVVFGATPSAGAAGLCGTQTWTCTAKKSKTICR